MLKFGTSGLRGLVSELTDQENYLYTIAFLRYISDQKLVKKNMAVAIAGDFRPSTKMILKACITAIKDSGFQADYCGIIPTPTISLYGFKRNIPSIMITGSHIPYDRNGIKFNLPYGEILKRDEKNITQYQAKISNSGEFDSLFNKKGFFKKNPTTLPRTNIKARNEYTERYLDFFEKNLLKGKKIVVYQHSSVMRDIMAEILKKLGAKVIPVERSEKFVPLDTEVISETELEKARRWTKKYKPDAIVSADGDGDRPMLFDETGQFIRGDLMAVVCSTYLKADSVSATVSCNTALEKSGKFKNINRTRIGSPYVIEAMYKAKKKGWKRIVSYEANGGYLTGSAIKLNGKKLSALPTRDSILPILSVLALAIKNKRTLSDLLKIFPQRFVYSYSLKGIPTETSQKILQKISKNNPKARKVAEKLFGLPAQIKNINFTDGVRMFLSNGEIVHVRPSNNAPELRIYVETDSFKRAQDLTKDILKKIAKLV